MQAAGRRAARQEMIVCLRAHAGAPPRARLRRHRCEAHDISDYRRAQCARNAGPQRRQDQRGDERVRCEHERPRRQPDRHAEGGDLGQVGEQEGHEAGQKTLFRPEQKHGARERRGEASSNEVTLLQRVDAAQPGERDDQ